MIDVTILILKLSLTLFLDGDVPRSASNGVYISQLIQFTRANIHFADFNTRKKTVNSEISQTVLSVSWYHKLRKTFFYILPPIL